MKRNSAYILSALSVAILVQCSPKKPASNQEEFPSQQPSVTYGGFESQIKWGEHLVGVGACNICHTPKKITATGFVYDSDRLLSGHPAQTTVNFDAKEISRKGTVLSAGFTAWAGPWGVSFTANLTPDDTGIGPWSEEQFIIAIREGKYKGLAGSRSLLPPMPWDMYRNWTDSEIRAVFAYLKSIKPVKNMVPPPIAPTVTQ